MMNQLNDIEGSPNQMTRHINEHEKTILKNEKKKYLKNIVGDGYI
jgi:hypothetical protein